MPRCSTALPDASNQQGGPVQSKEHWEKVYSTRATDEVSWFQPHAALSMKLIRDSGVAATASIIDVGGGASTLVDDLLADGFRRITVLYLSGAALAAAKARLGTRAADVEWMESNVLDAEFPAHSYDVWHDSAVFHFLTTEKERRAYVDAVLRAVKPGGVVIGATFAGGGPDPFGGL